MEQLQLAEDPTEWKKVMNYMFISFLIGIKLSEWKLTHNASI
jgi:hypothetical protein